MVSRILVIEDDRDIADAVAWSLRQEGHDVRLAFDGREGTLAYIGTRPDLVILDLMLPKEDGFSVFRSIRRRSATPVIMLTAKASEADRVAGLELGADDYITKPFSMRELIARVGAVLRRSAVGVPGGDEVLRVGGVEMDRAKREVTVDGRVVEFSPQEYALLECFLRNAGRAMTRQVLLEQAWHQSEWIDPRTVDVHVRWLRQKIEDEPSDPRRILTVRGVGYRFRE